MLSQTTNILKVNKKGFDLSVDANVFGFQASLKAKWGWNPKTSDMTFAAAFSNVGLTTVVNGVMAYMRAPIAAAKVTLNQIKNVLGQANGILTNICGSLGTQSHRLFL